MDTCDKREVYNLLIRRGDAGGLDSIDMWSTNIWIHDVMVTNEIRVTSLRNSFSRLIDSKDECVTVKSPSNNIRIENIYCNWKVLAGCDTLHVSETDMS